MFYSLGGSCVKNDEKILIELQLFDPHLLLMSRFPLLERVLHFLVHFSSHKAPTISGFVYTCFAISFSLFDCYFLIAVCTAFLVFVLIKKKLICKDWPKGSFWLLSL